MKTSRLPTLFRLSILSSVRQRFHRLGVASGSASRLAVICAALMLVASVGWRALPANAQPTEPNPTLQQIWLNAGIHRIRAEVAATPDERSRGLMLRTSLAPNHGMLFAFETVGVHCFWMKNTLVPLTIAFLGDDGTIVTLADMTPQSEQGHCPDKPVRFALEMQQGWFHSKGLKTGSRITGLK